MRILMVDDHVMFLQGMRSLLGVLAPEHQVAATQARLAGLTPRHVDVNGAAARGLPNKLIARELGIAEVTVKTHLTAVYGVLSVRNRTEAAVQAARDGVVIHEPSAAPVQSP